MRPKKMAYERTGEKEDGWNRGQMAISGRGYTHLNARENVVIGNHYIIRLASKP